MTTYGYGVRRFMEASAPSKLKDRLAVKFIFQPAEEVGRGALKMVEKQLPMI